MLGEQRIKAHGVHLGKALARAVEARRTGGCSGPGGQALDHATVGHRFYAVARSHRDLANKGSGPGEAHALAIFSLEVHRVAWLLERLASLEVGHERLGPERHGVWRGSGDEAHRPQPRGFVTEASERTGTQVQ